VPRIHLDSFCISACRSNLLIFRTSKLIQTLIQATRHDTLSLGARQLISRVAGNAAGMSDSHPPSPASTLKTINGLGTPTLDDTSTQSYDESLQQILNRSRESSVDPEDTDDDAFVYGGKDAAYADDGEDDEDESLPDEAEWPATNGQTDTHTSFQVSFEQPLHQDKISD
jgi:hypothetical protein